MQQARFPTIGEVFVGRYEILNVIGTGGFSQVYRARQTDLGREVAIKVLKPVNDPTKSEAERERKFDLVSKRFEREARLISRLKDRNTVVMYDYGATPDGLLYMVLEHVDGITIAQLLQTSGPLAPERVVKILRQALTSLHEAHTLGVLHRDIKPGNIMVYDHVGRADQVKVLDFGIAKTVDRADGGTHTTSSDVTADGVLVGTPRYMSPEQIRGKTLTAASDVYSLGLVAYEMLMGMKAVDADSSLRIIARHLDTDPIGLPSTLSMPTRLRSIINKMLIKDPAERFSSCEEVLVALEGWDENVQFQPSDEPTTDISISREAVMQVDSPGGSSSRWVGIGIAALLVAILAMSAPWILSMLQPAEPAQATEQEPVANDDPSTGDEDKPSLATVAAVEAQKETAETEPDGDDSEAAANAAARSVDAARTAATNQAPDEAPEDDPADSDAKPTPSKKVVDARADTPSRPKKRHRRTPRRKKKQRKEEKPSKVVEETADDLGLFGIE